MRIQREKKGYWDKYENYSLDLSSDELDCNEPSLNSLNFNDKKEDVIEGSRKKEDMHESLENNEKLEDNKSILKLVWKKDGGDYLWKARRYDSSTIKNWEIKHKKELKKLAF